MKKSIACVVIGFVVSLGMGCQPQTDKEENYNQVLSESKKAPAAPRLVL